MSSKSSVKRILADIKEIENHPSPFFRAHPLEENMFEWHFTIAGPPETDFEGGLYHGKIILPPEYPFKPPNFIFMTPNGRFQVGTKICLSFSSYHEETWQPAWGIRTMIEAIISFLPSPGAGAIGGLDWPSETRKKLAIESLNFCCPECGKIEDFRQCKSCEDYIKEEAIESCKISQHVEEKESSISTESNSSEKDNEMHQRDHSDETTRDNQASEIENEDLNLQNVCSEAHDIDTLEHQLLNSQYVGDDNANMYSQSPTKKASSSINEAMVATDNDIDNDIDNNHDNSCPSEESSKVENNDIINRPLEEPPSEPSLFDLVANAPQEIIRDENGVDLREFPRRHFPPRRSSMDTVELIGTILVMILGLLAFLLLSKKVWRYLNL